MATLGRIARRSFLIGAGAIAGGLAIGYWYGNRPWDNPLTAGDGEAVLNPWLKIGADGAVTVIVPRAEMGQGVTTTLAALVAEELEVPLAGITVEHGPASGAYYNTAMIEDGGPFAAFDESLLARATRSTYAFAGRALGLQGTGGSASARDAFDRMRQAGATARVLLVTAAASAWGVPPGEVTAKDGTLAHGASGRSASYGEFAAAAAALPVPAEVPLKPREQWTLLGKPQQRLDLPAKIAGAPLFGIDVDLPGLLHGTVRMSPRFGVRPAKADLSKAEAAPGVVKVVAIDTPAAHGFGIIATSTWAAFRAAELIAVEWEAAATPADSAAVAAALDGALQSGGGWALRDDGDVDTALADAPRDRIIEARYAVPFLAHAAMEPMNATAAFADGKLTLWTPDQVPTLTRLACAQALDIPMDDVAITTTTLGGGFGRRLESDFSVYAALLARHAEGRPVKVTWTREEDFTHDFYRPAAHARLAARLGDDGMPVAVDLAIAAPSIIRSVLGRVFPGTPAAGPDRLISEGAFDQPLAIPNFRVTGVDVDLGPMPVGMWRSVGNSANAFFHECALDEIAHAGGIDPVALRLQAMKDFPVAAGVVRKVADMAGWGTPGPAGTARGFAFCQSFGSTVAEIVQVSGSASALRIDKVWIAADLGTVLDPANVEAQMVSGAIYGLSAAMFQKITLTDGAVAQTNFHDYEALRMHNCPDFEVALLEAAPKMGGAGEPGTPPAAPALANAIFALTGKRIRSLPLALEVDFA